MKVAPSRSTQASSKPSGGAATHLSVLSRVRRFWRNKRTVARNLADTTADLSKHAGNSFIDIMGGSRNGGTAFANGAADGAVNDPRPALAGQQQ